MFAKMLAVKQDSLNDVPPGYVVKNQCFGCQWFHKEAGVTCDAFPKGIPLIILLGERDHSVPFSLDGVDDGGLVFLPAA